MQCREVRAAAALGMLQVCRGRWSSLSPWSRWSGRRARISNKRRPSAAAYVAFFLLLLWDLSGVHRLGKVATNLPAALRVFSAVQLLKLFPTRQRSQPGGFGGIFLFQQVEEDFFPPENVGEQMLVSLQVFLLTGIEHKLEFSICPC